MEFYLSIESGNPDVYTQSTAHYVPPPKKKYKKKNMFAHHALNTTASIFSPIM